MLPHLDLKLLRDLKRLTGQAAAVSLVMACGLAMLIMARSLIHSLDSTRAEYYQTNHFAEVFASLKRAPNDLAARIAALPGVATVQTGLAVPVTLDLPGIAEPAGGIQTDEPGYYILGAKSKGRDGSFLLRDGHEQIKKAFGIILGNAKADLYAKAA